MSSDQQYLDGLQREKFAFPFEVVSTDRGSSYFSPGMALRDYFAVTATDADIEHLLPQVRLIDKVLVTSEGRKEVVHARPDNARQIARYMHADAMLKARGER